MPTALGIALLYPYMVDQDRLNGGGAEAVTAAGVLLVLLGVTVLLPWVVEFAVRRAPAGSLPWQLAVRRLQLDGGTSGRVVGGIAVAVAGAIALQTIFSSAAEQSRVRTGIDTERISMYVESDGGPERAAQMESALASARGVRDSTTFVQVSGRASGSTGIEAAVASCGELSRLGLKGCRDGDAFVLDEMVSAGGHVRLGTTAEAPVVRVPRSAEEASLPDIGASVVLTPSLVAGLQIPEARTTSLVRFDREVPDVGDAVRDVVADVDPYARANVTFDQIEPGVLTNLRRILFAGAVGVLTMIGAALLIAAVEQLRERRRVLAVLAAFGTRRRTMAFSVLWQTAVPVIMGLLLAVGRDCYSEPR